MSIFIGMLYSSYSGLKINIKFNWSSRHFSQNINIRIKLGFSCINVCKVPREMLKTEGDSLVGLEGETCSVNRT